MLSQDSISSLEAASFGRHRRGPLALSPTIQRLYNRDPRPRQVAHVPKLFGPFEQASLTGMENANRNGAAGWFIATWATSL
jgi:hypothetical protein